jgi:hypothetical protein
MKIPFSMLPASWGLKGKSRKIAQLEYELTGEELDRELAKVNFEYDEKGLKLQNIKLDLKYGRTTEYDAKIAEVEIGFTGDEKTLALLDVNYHFGKINDHEYNKGVATLNKEPWVAVVDSNFDQKEGLSGFSFKLDFNEPFVEMLRESGFEGVVDEQVVNEWFNELCKQIASEEEFLGDQPMGSLLNPIPSPPKSIIGKDGKIKYS